MTMLQHPAWSSSKIPPRTLDKINRLNSADRRDYVSGLIANYALKLANIDAAAKKHTENWIKRQAEHLHVVVTELQAIEDLEMGRDPILARHLVYDSTDTKSK